MFEATGSTKLFSIVNLLSYLKEYGLLLRVFGLRNLTFVQNCLCEVNGETL
jgi:hypothetical protein